MKGMAQVALAALVFSAAACEDRRDRNLAEDVESAAEETGEQLRETGRDLREYTWEQRDEFGAAVRERARELDAEIEQLGRDTRGAAGTVSDEAMREIREARQDLDRRLARVTEAAEDDWSDVRSGVEGALEDVREAITEVRRSEGPMGGRAAGPS